MKIQSVLYSASIVVLACIPVHQARAIFGMGDTVVICGDLMDGMKWGREEAKWTEQFTKLTQQINQMRQQVEKADQMINIVGDPKRLSGELSGLLGDMTCVNDAEGTANFQTAAAALDLGESIYGLAAVGRKTLRDADRIDENYKMFDVDFKRDADRYKSYNMQKALIARFEAAVKNKEKVERKEIELQRALVVKMQDKNMTEQARLAAQAALDASKGRIDLANAKVDQTKKEYDMLTGRMKMEAEMKAEASTEEREAMIAALRQKALEAMKRQNGETVQ